MRETFFAALRAAAGLILPVFAEDWIVRLARPVFEDDLVLVAIVIPTLGATDQT